MEHPAGQYRPLYRLLRFTLAEIFRASLILYILASFTESLRHGAVTHYAGMNTPLLIVGVTGLLSVVFPEPVIATEPLRRQRSKMVLWTGFLAVAGALYVYSLIKTMGHISVVVSVLAGCLVGLLSWLVFVEGDGQEPSHDD